MKAMCGGDLEGFCKGLGGFRPCPDHERVIIRDTSKARREYDDRLNDDIARRHRDEDRHTWDESDDRD